MTRETLNSRERKRGTKNPTLAKAKFDRQIVAIAKVHRATAIYSDDGDVKSLGERAKIKVIGIADLELPPQDAQLSFVLTSEARGGARPNGESIGQTEAPPP